MNQGLTVRIPDREFISATTKGSLPWRSPAPFPAPTTPSGRRRAVSNNTSRSTPNFSAIATEAFENRPGESPGDGFYKGLYRVKPGLNLVRIQAEATIVFRHAIASCYGCSVQDLEFKKTGVQPLWVYGVEITPGTSTIDGEERVVIPVGSDNAVRCDAPIAYTISPPERQAP